MQKITHYLNIAFNVSSHEWPRILLAWCIKMFTQAAFVMGSTILLAMFVEQFGINKLPFMFIISALFIVLGSTLFAFVIDRLNKKTEIIALAILGVILFFIAPIFHTSSIIFYGLLFISISIFIAQLNIILALFIEELFSPLESERTFPLIESSEPVGGIVAGATLTLGVSVFHLTALNLLYVTAFYLFLVIPILVLFTKLTNKIPKLESMEEQSMRNNNRLEKTKKGLRHIKGMPFLKGMMIVVFLHFAFVSLIEFQYTSVLDSQIIHSEEATINTQAEPSHADALTHGLAFWHVMFSLLAFLTQIFGASRIHTKLGIIKSMTIHPWINILASVALIFKFGFVSGIAARGMFEITTMMHRTTYHASFYALKRSIREHVKEFLEGIVRPLGMIGGTIVLALLLQFTPAHLQHTVISITMLIIMTVMLLFLLKMKNQYTLIAKKNLNTKGSNLEKIEAIEVLSQNGHLNVTEILSKNLHEKQHYHIQQQILETLGKLQDVDAIPDILRMFHSKEKDIQFTAVESLTKYKHLGQHFFSQSFAKHRVTESLEELFLDTPSKKIKSKVIQVFKNINNADIIPFLLKILESKDEEIVADSIYVCGLFKDINSIHYLEKFLQSPNPRIKSAAIIALWHFSSYKLKTLIALTSMLGSKDEAVKIAGIYALGEIQAVQEIPRLEKLLEHSNIEIQCHAAIALAKMKQTCSTDQLVNFLMHEKKELVRMTQSLLKGVPEDIKKDILTLLKHNVSHKISNTLQDAQSTILEKISKEKLKKLQHYYELIAEMKEVIRIEEELEKRNT